MHYSRISSAVGMGEIEEVSRDLLDGSMEEKNVLPCKKCGAGFLRIVYSVGGRVAISCPKCSYCTKYKPTKEEAINAWNQRNRT